MMCEFVQWKFSRLLA